MIYNAKAIGYDYVGIRTITQGIRGEADYDFRRHPELFRLTKQAIADTGVDAADMIRAMNEDTVLALELPHWERARELGTFEHQRRVLESTKKYLREHGIE